MHWDWEGFALMLACHFYLFVFLFVLGWRWMDGWVWGGVLSSMRCPALRPADCSSGLSCSASALSTRARHARKRPDAGAWPPCRMTTTWPRYREECEQSYATCAYTHDCHMIEQEGRRLGSGNGAFAGDSFPRPPHSGGPGELQTASEGREAPASGIKASRERQREKRHGDSERHSGREEKRHHRSERHLRDRDPSPPPPPPPEQPEQPKQAAPTLGSNTVNLGNNSAADCVDCAAAQAQVQLQAQAAHIQTLPNGQPGMEVIESINPGKDSSYIACERWPITNC